MLFKRIKDWAVSIASFRTGDVIPVDGPNGTAKMSKDDLLTETAQSTLAGNIAPAFDPNKPNDDGGYAYYKDERVIHDGLLYEFIANHSSGDWSSSEVRRVNINETTLSSTDFKKESSIRKLYDFYPCHESLSLENKLYMPDGNENASTDYWSIRVFLRAGDVIGCLNTVYWNYIKMNWGVSAWEGYTQSNVTIPIDGIYTIAITRLRPSSGIIWDSRINNFFGKIVNNSKADLHNLSIFRSSLSLNTFNFPKVTETLSLENKLYMPDGNENASTDYWSIRVFLRAGDVIGFTEADESSWNYIKMNWGISAWEGYTRSNVTIPIDGIYTIAITRLSSSSSIIWDSRINNFFGKIVNNSTAVPNSCLSGKKLTCLGDSLTFGMGLANYQTWGRKIAYRNGMTFYNYGVNGNPIASKGNTHGMVERYSEMPNGCEYITVMGGANDMNQEIPIGKNSDNTIYTFKGAINTLIDGLRAKYPSGHICFMTSFKRYPSTQEKSYADAMLEVCALKAIPCKDNYTDSGIDFTNAAQAAIFEHSTYGKHFSEAGNEFISWGIEAFLKAH